MPGIKPAPVPAAAYPPEIPCASGLKRLIRALRARRGWRGAMVVSPLLAMLYLLMLPVYCLLQLTYQTQAVWAATIAIILLSCTVSVAHLGETRGLARALLMAGIAFTITMGFELLGVATGVIFGAYSYSDQLGPKVLGLVPVLIPIAWLMMLYPAYETARLLLPDLPKLLTLPIRAVVAAAAMTAWDLSLDPRMVHDGNWTWHNGGAGSYFGIPLSNYLGWLLTTLLVFLLYRLYEHWRTPPLQPALRASFPILPVLAYAVTMLANVGALAFTGQPAVAMIGLFSMGAFLAAALSLRMRSGALGGNNGT